MKVLSLIISGLLFLAAPASVSARPLEFDGERAQKERFKADRPQFPRDRDADILHVRLEITPDLASQSFEAVVTHRFKVLAPDLDRLELDARELVISKVTGPKGNPLDFEVLPEKLVIHFPKPLSSGTESSVRIEYSAAPRRMGLHFFKTDSRYPGQPDMVWSQGEADQNSYWIPMYDYPNERASTEIVATVPEGFSAVSNGKLISRGPGKKPQTTVFHWFQERPHVGYLITLSIARYVELKDSAKVQDGGVLREVPMTTWVLPGREEDAKRTFAKTPVMVSYFSDLLDSPYPWDKYDQVLVYEFFGGMENTSATNIIDRALMDKRAALDNDFDGLISHELAHQWFGDLITCKDWSHLWLNEGITSYFQAVWKAKDLGADEFAYDLYQKAQAVFSEEGAYKRAIVTDRYESPDDMFDRHTYEKGAWVLHMIRKELGEERFWKSFKRYIARHKDTVAETEDLRQAIEEATGKNMVEFFAQWLYGAGSPYLKIKSEWDQSEKKLTLKVTQKQAKEGQTFRLRLPVEFHGRGGKKVTAEISKAEETFSWDLPARPKMIRVDPEMTLLIGYDLEFPQDSLLTQLKEDPAVAGRVRAARTLSGKANPKVVAALRECLLKDSFWGVSATCAQELGSIGGPAALAALREGTLVKHPKVRRAAATALGGFLRQKEAFDALRPLAEKDESYNVEAAALAALGSLRLAEAKPLLESKLKVDSWNEVIRKAALSGMGRLKDETLIPTLQDWASQGHHLFARQAALGALAEAGEGKEAVRDFIALILETDDDAAVRSAAIYALTVLGDPKAGAALGKIAVRDPDPGIRRRASDAISDIREGKKGKIEDVSKQADQLNEKLERLEKRLDEFEKKKK